MTQAIFIAPYSGIVDHNRITDSVFFIIDFRWRSGNDELNSVAIADQAVLFLENTDGPLELAVDRIAEQ